MGAVVSLEFPRHHRDSLLLRYLIFGLRNLSLAMGEGAAWGGRTLPDELFAEEGRLVRRRAARIRSLSVASTGPKTLSRRLVGGPRSEGPEYGSRPGPPCRGWLPDCDEFKEFLARRETRPRHRRYHWRGVLGRRSSTRSMSTASSCRLIGIAGKRTLRNHSHPALEQCDRDQSGRREEAGGAPAYGDFISVVINFVIVAVVLFIAYQGDQCHDQEGGQRRPRWCCPARKSC